MDKENNYLIAYRKFSELFSMNLVIDKELVLASNMHEAITKLKELYNNLYDIIAISILDDSINFWEDIDL